MMPGDVENVEKKTKQSPDASKGDPRKHPRPEMWPEKARRGLKEEAQDPHGAQEADQVRNVSSSHKKIRGFKKRLQIP